MKKASIDKAAEKAGSYAIVLFYSLLLGLICGIIMWLFLFLMEYGIKILWDFIPSKLGLPYYKIIICMAGAVIIGMFHRKFGEYPEEMAVVFEKIKREGSYDYSKIPIYAFSAFLPLILGASIGPEAGLVGLIAGLCSFVKHKFTILNRQFADLANVGFSAALAVVFQSPLFGFIEPLEDDDFNIPKRSKTILYFTVILAAFGIFMLLNNVIPASSEGIGRLDGYFSDKREWILLLPCILIGYIGGFLFLVLEKYVEKGYGLLGEKHMLKALIGGAILGISGTLLPYTMFSGETQITELASEWQDLGVLVLLLTGLIKLFVTASCIYSGFRGGHFFPAIFSGISFGYGFSILLGINPVFCCAAVTSALMASILRKPVATALLLLLCFPLDSILILLIAAVCGSVIPIPGSLLRAIPDNRD